VNAITVEPIPSGRFILVPLGVGHAAEMTQVLSDPRLYAFTGGTPPTEDELRGRYKRWTDGSPDLTEIWCNWVIQLRSQPPVLAGTVQATISGGDDKVAAEIAWIVGTPWQGQGLASEAAQALVQWLRDDAIGTITAHIHPDHRASAAVATAAGLAPSDSWHEGERRWQLTKGTDHEA
jgi:RimJ/RimL family protein N-acetyltransferase